MSRTIVNLPAVVSLQRRAARSGLMLAAGLPSCASALNLQAQQAVDPCAPGSSASASVWVYCSADALAYKTLSKDDRITDFSTAGYMSGGLPIPSVPMDSGGHVLMPAGPGMDDTPAIQKEITRVSGLDLDPSGFRGAVVLGAGIFNLSDSLKISASGVVLRGWGLATVLQLPQNPVKVSGVTTVYPAVTFVPAAPAAPALLSGYTTVTNSYLPGGSSTMTVASTANLSVGMPVLFSRVISQQWIDFMGMNSSNFPLEPDGKTHYVWLSPGNFTNDFRTVKAISGNQVTLDSPIPDSVDGSLQVAAKLGAYDYSTALNNVGVEQLQIVASSTYIPNETEPANQPFIGVAMSYVTNGWIRNVTSVNTFNSMSLNNFTENVTLLGVHIVQNVTQPLGPQFSHFQFGPASGNLLVLDSTIDGAASYQSFFYEVSYLSAGPNVVYNSHFTGTGDVGGHQKWATAPLADNVTLTAQPSLPNGYSAVNEGFSDRNAGSEGESHGWDNGWNVVWNSIGLKFLTEMPPGSQSWCIGCVGATPGTEAPSGGNFMTPLGGEVESTGTFVQPASLYAAQLYERTRATPVVLADGAYRIVNEHSGLSLSVPTSSKNNSVDLDQEAYTGASSQQWTLHNIGSGRYTLTNVNSGKLVDVVSRSTNPGAMLDQYQADSDTNQEFTLNVINDGSYLIYNVNSGLRIEVINGSTASGALIDQQPSVAAHWRFLVP